MKVRNKLRILQYNVHKSRNKMMIALLQEEKIQEYNILVIQESWQHHVGISAYNSRSANFTLVNNDEKTYFYINKRIDSNNWHNTWHSKDVETITLQLQSLDDNTTRHDLVNVHDVYNSFLNSHNDTINKSSFLAMKLALHMQGESIIVKDFNLHHFSWGGPFYSRQHLLLENLLDIMRAIGVVLTLSRGTITRDYQGA